MSSEYVMSEEEKRALQFAKTEWPDRDRARLYCNIGAKKFFLIWRSTEHGFAGPQRFIAEKNGKYWWIDDAERYAMRLFIAAEKKKEENTPSH